MGRQVAGKTGDGGGQGGGSVQCAASWDEYDGSRGRESKKYCNSLATALCLT